MSKPFIIAEVGINHNGNLDLARLLIKGAKDAGANAVKFQKRTIEKVYTKEELDKYRESPWGNSNREQKYGLELDKEEYIEIDKYCKSLDIPWFASAWDLESAEFLTHFDLIYNKIPSPLLTYTRLLYDIAQQGRYTFISTGMSTIEEIGTAINIFKECDCSFEIMHCNSSYPTKDEDLNLLCIQTLKKVFGCKVGYSGHSAGIMDGVLAACLGATSVEKHITIDRTLYGSDQAASLEVHGFKKMVEYINYCEAALSEGNKIVTAEEEKIKAKLRRHSDVE
jgi:N-acetylneuraminate synthase